MGALPLVYFVLTRPLFLQLAMKESMREEIKSPHTSNVLTWGPIGQYTRLGLHYIQFIVVNTVDEVRGQMGS